MVHEVNEQFIPDKSYFMLQKVNDKSKQKQYWVIDNMDVFFKYKGGNTEFYDQYSAQLVILHLRYLDFATNKSYYKKIYIREATRFLYIQIGTNDEKVMYTGTVTASPTGENLKFEFEFIHNCKTCTEVVLQNPWKEINCISFLDSCKNGYKNELEFTGEFKSLNISNNNNADHIKNNLSTVTIDPKKLTFNINDDKIIIEFFMNEMIKEISKIFGFRKFEIFHYALTIIRRYYLNATLLDTDIRIMMYSSIIMAVKLSENKTTVQKEDNKIFPDIFAYAEAKWSKYKIATKKRK